MFSRLNSFAARNVYAVGIASMGLRYWGGDSAVQAWSGWDNGKLKDGWFNKSRSLAFAAFGFGYSPVMTTLYNKVYPTVIGLAHPMRTALADCLSHGPLMYFPVFYICKEMAFSPPSEVASNPFEVARRGVRKYTNNFFSDMKLYLSVWLPLHYMNFKFFPRAWAMPVMAVQGVIWVAALSMFRGDAAQDTNKAIEHDEDTEVDVDVDVDVDAGVKPHLAVAATRTPPRTINLNLNVTRAVVPHHVKNYVEPHMRQAAAAAKSVAMSPQRRSRSTVAMPEM